jgi:cell wall-associated NlpC family hydrolase
LSNDETKEMETAAASPAPPPLPNAKDENSAEKPLEQPATTSPAAAAEPEAQAGPSEESTSAAAVDADLETDTDPSSETAADAPENSKRPEPPPAPGIKSGQRLDPRRHAFRPDLAADNLRGHVEAARFVSGEWAQVVIPCAQIRNKPSFDAPVDTEALFGEVLVIYEIADGWAWVQILRDGYVGYTSVDAISSDVEWPTHRVKAIGTFVYPEPDIKKPPLAHLSLNSALRVAERVDDFYRLTSGGYVHMRHVAGEENFARDFVDVAERFIGTPYLWGGRTRLGIDCSGLVQIALEAAGIPAPRDSDMQRAELGNDVLIREDYEGVQRGDLVFWPGHVGIMVDGLMLLHANAHHMAVTHETLPEAIERIAKTGDRPTAIKRLDAAIA